MVKVGIIGAGRIGKVHITSISTRVRDAVIKTVADPFMNEKTAAWAKGMGVQHTTKDYEEIIRDPEIDAVLICSSTDTHSPFPWRQSGQASMYSVKNPSIMMWKKSKRWQPRWKERK